MLVLKARSMATIEALRAQKAKPSPSSLILLQAALTDRRARSRAFGLWGAIAGIGAASGPIVGGVLISV
jgi:hypothetical protein